jgi:oligopeptide transport system substrate-binding protein
MFHRKKGRTRDWFAGAVVAVAVLASCSHGPEGGELDLFTYNAADGIRTLDPARATDLETLWIVDQMYEGLLEFDDDLGVVPALADRWSVSEDGLTYAFGLRPGVQFHDGSALTAQDVVLSFERMLDPANALPGRWVLSGVAEEGGVLAMGSDSVELRLDAPNPVFASLLATPQASILRGGGVGVELQ